MRGFQKQDPRQMSFSILMWGRIFILFAIAQEAGFLLQQSDSVSIIIFAVVVIAFQFLISLSLFLNI